MEQFHKDQLNSLIIKMAEMKVIDCKMTHELIKRKPDSIMPLPAPAYRDTIYFRGDLCDKQSRRHLGCAHTGYRARAQEMATDFAKALPQASIITKHYIQTLNDIEMNIIRIDNARQDAEATHADISKAFCLTSNQNHHQKALLKKQLEKAQVVINHLIRDHHRENDKIRKLQEQFVTSASQLLTQ